MSQDINQLCINTIRLLSADAIQKANSGHPGMPMGCAPIAYLLYTKIMRHNPQNPNWINRDRFILSAGHGSMLLYSTLHLCGYDISLNDIMNFRQWESITPGHPEYGHTAGVETTTGPLGQGFANAVGMAVAQSHLAARFNKDDIKLVDHNIFGICSDGDLMEGISHEAASFAGHNKLGSLVFFYDSNNITIDGKLSLTMSEKVGQRFEAYGWHVQHVKDVNDLRQLESAAVNGINEKTKPSIIITNTIIGYGSPNKNNTPGVHGSPLGEEEIKLTKQYFGFPQDKSFYIPEEAKNHFEEISQLLAAHEQDWDKKFETYKSKYPGDAGIFQDTMENKIPEGLNSKYPVFEDFNEKLATRSASGKVLTEISGYFPALLGGSADLTPSNNTRVKSYEDYSPDNYAGRYIHYGIRENAMSSIMNGMSMYGGVIPYGGTFLVFSDYLRPSIRLACLSKIKTILVFTHDSIGLGEDGPTHQPVEHIASLRAIPGLVVIRPADANETSEAWKFAVNHVGSPVALLLTRQKLPVLDRNKYGSVDGLQRGAYIIKDSESTPDLIILASGSEVHISIQAAEKLDAEGIKTRVVSFPSWEIFESQKASYKEKILPADVKARLAVEAGISQGWSKYVGDYGNVISIEGYGSSAPYEVLLEKYGFTVDNILIKAKQLLSN